MIAFSTAVLFVIEVVNWNSIGMAMPMPVLATELGAGNRFVFVVFDGLIVVSVNFCSAGVPCWFAPVASTE